MISRVIVRARAKHDIRAARRWYRDITYQLGEEFLRSVDDAIRLAQERPRAFQVAHRTFRRVLVHRFPYAVFYHAEENRIIVVAVLHQARDPHLLDHR